MFCQQYIMNFGPSHNWPHNVLAFFTLLEIYLQTSRFIIFLFNRSINLPGVATTICRPCLIDSLWSFTEVPPIHNKVFNGGKPSISSALENSFTISNVCFANSRDGDISNPYGPSPVNGNNKKYIRNRALFPRKTWFICKLVQKKILLVKLIAWNRHFYYQFMNQSIQRFLVRNTMKPEFPNFPSTPSSLSGGISFSGSESYDCYRDNALT